MVVFKPLTLPQIERIVDLQFAELRGRLAERRITLELTEEARRLIAAPGVRPGLRRPAAAPLHRPRSGDPHRPDPAGGDVHDGATVRVDARGGELLVTYHNPSTPQEAA